MALSFASAQSNQDQGADYSFEEIGNRLLRDARSVAQMLAPGGGMEGAEYVVRNPTRHDGKPGSFKINTRTGMWSDFATDARGGDLISFWAYVNGIDQGEAKAQAVEYLGLDGAHRPAKRVATIDIKPQHVESPAMPGPIPSHDEAFDFVAADGSPFIVELRTNVAGGKKYSQYNARDRLIKPMPSGPKPLYNLPALIAADPSIPIVVTEGARKAKALIEQGYLATACLNGALGTSKSDWSPLRGRHIVAWPDNDKAGGEFLDGVRAQLQGIAASLRVVEIPKDKPAKWDAYDATPAEREALIRGTVTQPPAPATDVFNPDAWDVSIFERGRAPARKWLVHGLIPLATAGLFVAMGDTGKGMLLLDMALKVASGKPDDTTTYEHAALGGTIEAHGRVAILSAEDDRGEIWRRLDGIDPDGARRARASGRMKVMPLPNMGGVKAFFVQEKGEVKTTKQFQDFRAWCMAQDDLVMIAIDPLSAFSHVDPNAAEVGGFVTGVLAALAADTGAAVIVAHHMRKTGQGRDAKVNSVEAARGAVRGSGALVDGVRWAYVLWPVDDATLKMVKSEVKTTAAFHGAVVKSNGPADRSVRTFYRHTGNGLLVELPFRADEREAAEAAARKPLLDALYADIAWASENGRPYVLNGKTGNGLWAWRHLFAESLQQLKKTELIALGDELLKSDRIVQAGEPRNYLCVIDDPYHRAGTAAIKGTERTKRDPTWTPPA